MEIIIFILLIVNLPVYKFIFKQIFIDIDDALNSIKFSFTPDIFSLFKGRYLKDRLGEFKLGSFIFLCVLVIMIEYSAISFILGLF